MYIYIISLLIDILEIKLFVTGAYYLAVAFFSLFGKKRKGEGDIYSYAVLIPAHNEEKTIEPLIRSIRNANYPQDKISIFVIADGCTDRTAEIARLSGAEVVIRKVSSDKGDALKEGFLTLQNKEFDCVTVFDADNLIDENFFLEMSEYFSSGAYVVQGYVDSKNPNSSWVSNAYSIWYWITNRVFQAGRERLSLGCRINGTGFALKKEVLDKVKWNTQTTAEDTEYTAVLALNDIKVNFCERAVVYDEKPDKFIPSVRQRIRWTQGICDVQGEYSFKLLKAFKINALLCLWGDLLFVMCPLMLLLSYMFNVGRIWQTTVGAITLLVFFLLYVMVIGLALFKDKKLNLKLISNIFGFILYMLSWIPIGLMGLFGKRRGWSHTKHS